jgi:hypothetical protein
MGCEHEGSVIADTCEESKIIYAVWYAQVDRAVSSWWPPLVSVAGGGFLPTRSKIRRRHVGHISEVARRS